MNRLTVKYDLAWIVVLAGLIVAAGCGASPGAACQFDSDCFGESICLSSICSPLCTADSECEAPFEGCELRERSREEPVRVCVMEQTSGDGDDEDQCRTNSDCRERLDDEQAICSSTRQCVVPTPRYGVLIRDISSPGSNDDHGVELISVSVESNGFVAAGYPIAYQSGDALEGQSQDVDLGQLTGNLQLTDSSHCLSPDKKQRAIPLGGTGGYLLVAFKNSADERLQLQGTWNVRIAESGKECGEENTTDGYAVYLCKNTTGRPLNPATDCETRLGEENPLVGYNELSIVEEN